MIAASTTEDLPTKSTVVPPTEGGEFLTTVIALFALAVRHPVLLQVTVLALPFHDFFEALQDGAEAS